MILIPPESRSSWSTTFASSRKTTPPFVPGSAGYGPDQGTVTNTFDPGAVTNAKLVDDDLFVFIGGTVTAAVAQTPGTYNSTITLTVAYTGS